MSANPVWMQPSFWVKKRFYIATPITLFVLFLVLVPRPALPVLNRHDGTTFVPEGEYRAYVGSGKAPRERAANATLGFEKLLALSTGPSWRTRGLQAAAEYTGLHFEIPFQPHNPPEIVHAFERIGANQKDIKLPKHGSAMAWLAHLDLLKYVIASGWESAFIVEDDIDWDTRLFDQMRMLSDNVRQYLNTSETDPNPYGEGWDVLWLGHCGELSNIDEARKLQYDDPTRPTLEEYGGWSKKFLREFVPEGVRLVQEVSQPVCSFGYGVTRESAQKILNFLYRGADEAFDVAMQHHCLAGNLRCISVNPEIMHHYEPDGDHGYVSQVKEADGKGHSAEEAEYEHIKGKTSNIVYSARCKALFDETCLAPPWELNH